MKDGRTPDELDPDNEILTSGVREFENWETTTRDARQKAERDRDYYDGKQWTEDEESTLKERGQAAVVKNRIFKKVNYLLGVEISGRQDPKALPVTVQHDDDSRAITDGLRYVVSKNDFDDVSSDAWENLLIEGYCGAIVEKSSPTNAITMRHVQWDRLWYDVHSRRPDFSDARSLGLSIWMYLDDAIDEYRNRKEAVDEYESVLREAVTQSTATGDETHDDKPLWVASDDQQSKRVRILERYFPKKDANGIDQWYFCAFTRTRFLIKPRPTGYLDEDGNNICPLVMASCFVTRDGERYGLVRHMIGPQDEINKRSSKALHLISTRQFAVESGAVENIQEMRAEAQKPGGVLELNDGALTKGKFQPLPTGDMAQGQFALLAESKNDIDSIGPGMPQLEASSASSGRAIMVRQKFGSLEISKPSRHHKRWKLLMYHRAWWMIRQLWTEEKWLRVTDDSEKTGYRFVGLNRRVTKAKRLEELLQNKVPLGSAMDAVLGMQAQEVLEQAKQATQALIQQQMQMSQQGVPGQGAAMPQQPPPELVQQVMMNMIMQHPVMQEQFTAADVATLKVDIEIDESPDVAVLQQEQFDILAGMMPTAINARPDLTLPFLEELIEASDLRSKKRMLEILRQPPDQQAAQMQQAAAQLQMAKAQSDIQKTQADTGLSAARAAREQVETQAIQPRLAIEAQSKQAEAIKDAAVAGRMTVPDYK